MGKRKPKFCNMKRHVDPPIIIFPFTEEVLAYSATGLTRMAAPLPQLLYGSGFLDSNHSRNLSP